LNCFVVLAAIFIIGLAVVLPFGEWQGWNWKAALLLAPASGVSQELFFRSALLPAMGLLFKGKTRMALVLHSVLFGLWHSISHHFPGSSSVGCFRGDVRSLLVWDRLGMAGAARKDRHLGDDPAQPYLGDRESIPAGSLNS
jgi:membrane protease YdiL (CAAX protease family)